MTTDFAGDSGITAADLAADKARALALTPVSRETSNRLDRLVETLLPVQAHTNLIAASTVSTLWTRHIADSLQLLALAPDAKTWADLGSGGGFPGLVLAAVLADQPGTHVHLVESNQKKAAFLRDAARAMGVAVTVHPMRIEDFALSPQHFDVLTTRALARLDKLCPLIAPLMRPGTTALLMKGRETGSELHLARRSWTIRVDLVPSLTAPDSYILVVRQLAPGAKTGPAEKAARP